jgi:SAM-dependent methyltransferase
MKETSKCHEARVRMGHFSKYLKGSGIDIGSGDDPLRPLEGGVRGWDVKDGDAALLRGVPDGSMDFVYSSHCLEHLGEPRLALSNWARVLRPGGHLYVVVPDFTLYEKDRWPPSNKWHKHSFSMTTRRVDIGRDDHWNMMDDVVPALWKLGISVRELRLEDDNYDYSPGMLPVDQTYSCKDVLAQICLVGRKASP